MPVRALLLVLFLGALGASAPPAAGQSGGTTGGAEPPTFRYYLGGRGGVGFYGGERVERGGPWNEFKQTSTPGLGVELGLVLHPSLTLGLYYLPGRFPFIMEEHPRLPEIEPDASSEWVHMIGLVTRWRLFRLGVAAPYAHGGVAAAAVVLNDNVRLGAGPRFGGGLEVAVGDALTLFAEGDVVAIFPDVAVDDAAITRAYDPFGLLGFGARYRFGTPRTRPARLPPRLLGIRGSPHLTVGEEGLFAADVELREAEGPVLYTWTFGDGGTAGDRLATHTYARPGTYTVTFTARAGGVVLRDSLTTVVTAADRLPEVLAILTDPPTARAGDSLRFEPSLEGTPPLTCVWDFGDGTTTIGCTPEHAYAEAGTYTVHLNVLNAVGQTERTRTLEVEPNVCAELPPLADVYFEPGSAELSIYARAVLRTNLEILIACPRTTLVVVGYATPDEGDPAALSAERAETVATYYRNYGIDEARLQTIAAGEHPDREAGLAAWQFRLVSTRLLAD